MLIYVRQARLQASSSPSVIRGSYQILSNQNEEGEPRHSRWTGDACVLIASEEKKRRPSMHLVNHAEKVKESDPCRKIRC